MNNVKIYSRTIDGAGARAALFSEEHETGGSFIVFAERGCALINPACPKCKHEQRQSLVVKLGERAGPHRCEKCSEGFWYRADDDAGTHGQRSAQEASIARRQREIDAGKAELAEQVENVRRIEARLYSSAPEAPVLLSEHGRQKIHVDAAWQISEATDCTFDIAMGNVLAQARSMERDGRLSEYTTKGLVNAVLGGMNLPLARESRAKRDAEKQSTKRAEERPVLVQTASIATARKFAEVPLLFFDDAKLPGSAETRIDRINRTITGLEIFRAGNYGERGAFDRNDLAAIAASYNPDRILKAPFNLDHQQSGPALGWVSRVYASGDSLFADAEQVSPDLLSRIENGAYHNRSAEIYRALPDASGKPYLAAVAWLGAQRPQVKGMASNFTFSGAR